MANEATIDVHFLDAEFNKHLQLARDLMKQMRLAEDRRVSEKYIRFCLNMKNSDQLRVKLHRNRFFRYLLKTMKRSVAIYEEKIFLDMGEGVEINDVQPTSQFSEDNRSYVAAKIIPGFGTLIYMACTSGTESEWDLNGFANFANIDPVPSNAPNSQEQ